MQMECYAWMVFCPWRAKYCDSNNRVSYLFSIEFNLILNTSMIIANSLNERICGKLAEQNRDGDA